MLFSSPPASRTEAEQDAAVCRRLQRGFWRLSGIKTPKSPAEIYAPFSVGSAQAFGEGQGKSQKRGNEVAEAFCFFLTKLNYAPSSRLEFRGSAAGATSTLDSPHFNRDVRNWGEGTPSAGLRTSVNQTFHPPRLHFPLRSPARSSPLFMPGAR